ncbi:hypothetical protein HU763_013895 [Pseudomonas anuradhapurensis]|uniref:hypothetical protein n=1 Tax=Pseudomonas anuradhapurensis TaxID=485870 RepID=UPI0016455A14|nr:hypothetical protein [Pseudomonas anuradhapurensis]QXI45874.1 hypothetical protein HU763_013895 [Pseudomonas anuradhapurensis]
MKFEGTYQYMGNHGIVFSVSQITLTDSERGRLRELHFGEAKRAHFQVNSKVVEIYDKVQAKNLPCVMMVGISQPLTRQQADTLNTQRTSIANLALSAFGGAARTVGNLAGPLAGLAAGTAVGMGVRSYVNDVLPTYHAGDVIVSIQAQVNGGIGPQRTAE